MAGSKRPTTSRPRRALALASAAVVNSGRSELWLPPTGFYLGTSQRHFAAQVAAFQTQQPTVPITIADALGDHPGVIEAIAQQVKSGATRQAPRRHGHSHSHGHPHGQPSLANAAAVLPEWL